MRRGADIIMWKMNEDDRTNANQQWRYTDKGGYESKLCGVCVRVCVRARVCVCVCVCVAVCVCVGGGCMCACVSFDDGLI